MNVVAGNLATGPLRLLNDKSLLSRRTQVSSDFIIHNPLRFLKTFAARYTIIALTKSTGKNSNIECRRNGNTHKKVSLVNLVKGIVPDKVLLFSLLQCITKKIIITKKNYFGIFSLQNTQVLTSIEDYSTVPMTQVWNQRTCYWTNLVFEGSEDCPVLVEFPQ